MHDESYTPVNEGDVLDVKIEAVGDKGDGICRKQGFVLVVPKTKKGDNVKIRVTKVLRSVGFAEVVEKLKEKTNEDYLKDVDIANVEEKPTTEELPPPGDPIYTEDF